MYAMTAESSLKSNSSCNRMLPGSDDHSSEEGAAKLAKTISDYWLKRGYGGIKTWVEKVASPIKAPSGRPAAHTIYVIESNIGPDGYPPRQGIAMAA